MRQQKANEDESSGESANNHFHIEFSLSSVETGRDQSSYDHAVETANNRVARQRASTGRTADASVISEAQTTTDYRTNNDTQDHDASPSGSAWNPASDNLAILFIEYQFLILTKAEPQRRKKLHLFGC